MIRKKVMKMNPNIFRTITYTLKPELYLIKNTKPPCGRDICYCLHTLDMNSREQIDYYKRCYSSWSRPPLPPFPPP